MYWKCVDMFLQSANLELFSIVPTFRFSNMGEMSINIFKFDILSAIYSRSLGRRTTVNITDFIIEKKIVLDTYKYRVTACD